MTRLHNPTSIPGLLGSTPQPGTPLVLDADGNLVLGNASVRILGRVPTEGDLPPDEPPGSNTLGDAYITDDDNHLWVWQDEPAPGQWVDTGPWTTDEHDFLVDVTPDQHHAQEHAHDGSDGSGQITHFNTTGKTPDDHHDQVHLLYGADHSDIDIAPPLQDRHVLAVPAGLGDWTPEFRMNWRGAWIDGVYYEHDVSRDGSWTMVANKETSDRPAPQPIGVPVNPAPAAWDDNLLRITVRVSNEYVFAADGYITAAIIYVHPNNVGAIHNTSSFIDGVIHGNSSLVPGSAGEYNVPIEPVFVTAGTELILSCEVEQAGNVDVGWYSSPGWWATPPVYLTSAQGFLDTSGDDSGTPGWSSDAYGVSFTFQEAVVSPDWDLLAYGSDASGGGGGGTGDNPLPPGGLTDQALTKIDGQDYNVEWSGPYLPLGDYTPPTPQTYLHEDLTDVTADQHHTKYTDAEAIAAVGPHTPPQTYLHEDLTDVSADQHHPQLHDLDSHTDVLAPSPAEGQRLGFNGTDWIPVYSPSAIGFAEFPYRIDASINPTPSPGDISGNTLSGTTNTIIYINEENADGVDISLFLDELGDGDWVNIHDPDDVAGTYIRYDVIGEGVHVGDVWEFPVSFFDRLGPIFTNNQRVRIYMRFNGPDPFSGDHDDLSNVTADQHHVKYTDAEAIAAVGPHTTLHADLTDVSTDQHHTRYTDAEAEAAVGPHFSGDHADLSNVTASQHHIRYTDDEAIAAVGGTYLPLAGGTMTGPIVVPDTTSIEFGTLSQASIRGEVNGATLILSAAGEDIMSLNSQGVSIGGTRTLIVNGDPLDGAGGDSMIGNRGYNDARYLSLSGGTMTGSINFGGQPLNNVYRIYSGVGTGASVELSGIFGVSLSDPDGQARFNIGPTDPGNMYFYDLDGNYTLQYEEVGTGGLSQWRFFDQLYLTDRFVRFRAGSPKIEMWEASETNGYSIMASVSNTNDYGLLFQNVADETLFRIGGVSNRVFGTMLFGAGDISSSVGQTTIELGIGQGAGGISFIDFHANDDTQSDRQGRILVSETAMTLSTTGGVPIVFSPQTQFAFGSAAAPGISFGGGENNKGMYRYSATALGWAIGGGSRMVLGTDTFYTEPGIEDVRFKGVDAFPTTAVQANVYIDLGSNRGRLWVSTSSRRYKSNIDYDTDYLADTVLQPVSFWSDTDEREMLGFIAEDVVAVEPRAAVMRDDVVDNFEDRALMAILVAKVNRLEAQAGQ